MTSPGAGRVLLLRRLAPGGDPMSLAFGKDDFGQVGGSGSSWLRCDLKMTRPAGEERGDHREPCGPGIENTGGRGLVNATGENRVKMRMHLGVELLNRGVFL